MIILAYHCISNNYKDDYTVTPSLFYSQMAWLQRAGYRAVSVEEGLEQFDNKKLICLTFDDGYEDNYINALPVLKEFDFTGTLYLVPDYIGLSNVWDQPKLAAKKLADNSQLLEMENYGIRFGSHTQRHCDLRTMSIDQIENDLRESRKKLESFLTREVESFSYPWGAWRPAHLALLKKSGYKCAVNGSTYGRNKLPRDIFKLHRIEISQSDGLHTFMRKIQGFYFWKYYVSRLRTEWDWAAGRLLSRNHK